MAKQREVAHRPGILEMVSRVEGGPFYTIKQVSRMIDRDPDTIRRWQKQEENEHLKPGHQMQLGDGTTGQFVWLYTKDDVKRLREHSAKVRPGRPRKVE
jgi:hypothetical protein